MSGMRWRRVAGLILAIAGILTGSDAHADRLDTIRLRGSLVVGVKFDYPPFGMLDPAGALVGFEPDLAADVAKRLGVGLKLVGVTTANRLQKLEDGTVDLLIATMADTPQRRQITTVIEPNYYAAGVTLMVPRETHVRAWDDLRGKKVCATQGAYYNRPMAERYLLDLQVFNNTRDTKLALREGRCIGWLYDDTGIANDLRSSALQGYWAPLPSTMVQPWAMAIAQSERRTTFERTLSNIVAAWHRDGWLQQVESRWGMQPSPYLADKHALWSRTEDNGQYFCTRQPNGTWPIQCRNLQMVRAREAEGLEDLGQFIKDGFDLDFSLVYDAYDRGLFLRGLRITAQLVVACIFGSFAVGVLGWWLAHSRLPLVGRAVRGLATVTTMTPPLLLIYAIFFGIGGLMVSRFGWSFDGFVVASAVLSAYAGAAVALALIEADRVLSQRDGENRSHRPTPGEVLRLAYAPVVASLVNVVKATGLASVIAVPELIQASTAIVTERGNAGVMMNVQMVTYFLIVMGVVRIFNFIERKVFGHVAG